MTHAFLSRRALIAATLACAVPAQAQTLDKVSFGTNWVAEAEHGGFYQAIADGTYRKYGLDVTIVPGGPQVNNRLPLLSGKIDFYMGGNMLQSFSAVAVLISDSTTCASTCLIPVISRITTLAWCFVAPSSATSSTCAARSASTMPMSGSTTIRSVIGMSGVDISSKRARCAAIICS